MLGGKPVDDMSIITSQKWSDTDRYALPQNLLINLEDVRAVWNWAHYDTAQLISKGLIRPGRAAVMAETALENLTAVYRELETSVEVDPLEDSLQSTNFWTRWNSQEREFRLVRSVPNQDLDRIDDLNRKFEVVRFFADKLLNRHGVSLVSDSTTDQHSRGDASSRKTPATKKGRTDIWDWPTVFDHLDKLFDERGDLSPDDHSWSRPAHVGHAMRAFILSKTGDEPVRATIQRRVKEYLKIRGERGPSRGRPQ